MSDQSTEARTEKVARAIFAADSTDADWKWQDGRWERGTFGERERYLRLATAALAAGLDEPRAAGDDAHFEETERVAICRLLRELRERCAGSSMAGSLELLAALVERRKVDALVGTSMHGRPRIIGGPIDGG